jgi:hypothetical protein
MLNFWRASGAGDEKPACGSPVPPSHIGSGTCVPLCGPAPALGDTGSGTCVPLFRVREPLLHRHLCSTEPRRTLSRGGSVHG